MNEDWTFSKINNSRTVDNSFFIRSLIELYESTGNVTYYQKAAWLLHFIQYYHRNAAYGGYHIEVDGTGTPNYEYYPYGYLPGLVACASGSLLRHDPTNASFLNELTYALDFALSMYWDDLFGGYCYSYNPAGTIYRSSKPLYMQNTMLQAFLQGYQFTRNETYLEHAIEIGNFISTNFADPGSVFFTRLDRDLNVIWPEKDSGSLAGTVISFLDLYNVTMDMQFLTTARYTSAFIISNHFDPSYLGFYSTTDAAGTPLDTNKNPFYQALILSALLHPRLGSLSTFPPTTTPTPPPSLIPLPIIGLMIVVILIPIIGSIILVVSDRRTKPAKVQKIEGKF
jgi:uncharacterized protein YyaL (SSP411 family)